MFFRVNGDWILLEDGRRVLSINLKNLSAFRVEMSGNDSGGWNIVLTLPSGYEHLIPFSESECASAVRAVVAIAAAIGLDPNATAAHTEIIVPSAHDATVIT